MKVVLRYQPNSTMQMGHLPFAVVFGIPFLGLVVAAVTKFLVILTFGIVDVDVVAGIVGSVAVDEIVDSLENPQSGTVVVVVVVEMVADCSFVEQHYLLKNGSFGHVAETEDCV